MNQRPRPLGFLLWKQKEGEQELAAIDFVKATQGIWIDGEYELIVEREGASEGEPVRLYNIVNDPEEKKSLAGKYPDIVARMLRALEEWKKSVRASYERKDTTKKE